MNRREAREQAFSIIFEYSFHAGEDADELYRAGCVARGEEECDYARDALRGVIAHLPEIDACIARHATGWRPERISAVSRAILRLAIYEMLYVEDVPAVVAVNEAVELAKKYDADKAPAFVNGLLNAAMKEATLA